LICLGKLTIELRSDVVQTAIVGAIIPLQDEVSTDAAHFRNFDQIRCRGYWQESKGENWPALAGLIYFLSSPSSLSLNIDTAI